MTLRRLPGTHLAELREFRDRESPIHNQDKTTGIMRFAMNAGAGDAASWRDTSVPSFHTESRDSEIDIPLAMRPRRTSPIC